MIDGRVRWLSRELPQLVTEGLLTPEAAQAIRLRYARRDGGSGRRLVQIAFGVLGAKLIGSGLILLIAHNWEALSQSVRAGIALGLLAGAQGLCAFASLKRDASTAWRESTAAFLALAIGASMAMISQTYNVLTDPQDFMLRWIVLALPVVYLTRSRVTAALYAVGVAWATAVGEGWDERGWILWALAAAFVPYLVRLAREKTDGGRSLVFWSVGSSLPFAAAWVVGEQLQDAWMVGMTALFAALLAWGLRLAREGESPWHRPLPIFGAVGTAGLGLAMSFRSLWRDADLTVPNAAEPWVACAVTWTLTGLALGWTTSVAVRSVRRGQWSLGVVLGLPAVAAAGFAVALVDPDAWAAVILTNAAVFGVGLIAVLHGIAGDRLLVANAGMGLLSALFFFRFLDADLTLVLRGVAFIAIGTAFLAMNLRLLRARREELRS